MADNPSNEYKSPMSRWDSYASVRTGGKRELNDMSHNFLPFSPDMMPVLNHPLIRGLPQQTIYTLLAHRLYDYLRFTDYLETESVVPAAMLLARGQLDVSLPKGLLFDGRRIATDEMYHAQCAEDLLCKIADHTGIEPPQRRRPGFLSKLHRLHHEAPPIDRGLSIVFFSIVSETLITSLLKELPNDERVLPLVRDVVRDHNLDEVKHSIYFSKVLETIWFQLRQDQQEFLGRQVPRFIELFLSPDKAVMKQSMINSGISMKTAEVIWNETHDADSQLKAIREAAQPTIQRFCRVQAFEINAIRESFESFGLLG